VVELSYLISESAEALPMETLPAWKITHFCGTPARGQVYAYLRCYIRGGAICYCATVFDSAPRPTARFGFAFTPGNEPQRYLFLSCAKDAAPTLRLYERGEPEDVPVRTLTPPSARQTTGSDEQGEYWSEEGEVPAEVLQGLFGHVPQCGDVLPANAFLYDAAEAPFGAACPVPPGKRVPTAAGLGTMVVIPY